MVSQLASNSILYKDSKGQVGGFRFFTFAASPADQTIVVDAIISATNLLTNGAFFSAPGNFAGAPLVGELGTDDTYADITFRCSMVFVAADHTIHRYGIPAPILGKFLSDGTTINAADTDVAAWITAMLTVYAGSSTVCARSTSPLTNFVGGFLQKRKQRRRLNAFILNPSETGPAE